MTKLRLTITVLALIGAGACSDEDGVAQGSGAAGGSAGSGGGGTGGQSGSAGAGTSGGGGAAATGGNGATTPGGPIVNRKFSESDAELLNPERGFYDGVDLIGGGSFSHVRSSGRTLAYDGVRLDAFRDAPLDEAFLSALGAGFEKARQAGIKIVLRFVYNNGPYPVSEPDAPLARVLEHLGQLEPVLDANADVIAVMQAGLIGAWGEWHTSTNGLDSAENKETILLALLDALPASRMTQIRTPRQKSDIFGAALTDDEGFDGSHKARTGHHNDCFLATASDYGTYPSPIETWKDYVAGDGRFTPVGGETCALNPPRTDCPEATEEMERLHWSFLNALYNTSVIGGWQSQGCLSEVKRRLGYRFSFVEADYSGAVRPGGVIALALSVKSSGYASPFNPRPVFVVLDGGGVRRTAQLSAVDPRRWQSGELVTISVALRVPADLAPGTYKLGLWLPDAAQSIAQRSEYAIEFANDGVWNDGYNLIADDVSVDPTAPGDADPSATTFAEIP
jgi:hypothetical protein